MKLAAVTGAVSVFDTRPSTIQVYSKGVLVTARRFGNAYMLPDGTLIRWLVW